MSRRALRGFAPAALARARSRRKMSQGDLARLARVSLSTLASWEQGRRSPTVDALARVVDVLGVAIGDVVPIPQSERTLADLRIQVGLTQPQMAATLSVSTQRLGTFERGEAQPCGDTLDRLAAILGTTPEHVHAAWQRARDRPPRMPA